MKYLREIAVFAVVTILMVALLFYAQASFSGNEHFCGNPDAADYAMKSKLMDYQGEIQNSLLNLSGLTGRIAVSASYLGLQGDEIQRELDSGVNLYPGIVTIGAFDKEGVVTAMSPESHSEIVGWDLSKTPVVSSMNDGMVPQMTDLFALSEGGYAASINYPVFSPEKEYIGFISLTFDPYTIVEGYASELMNETGFQMMILQKNGVVLFDTDINEVGNETFGNPMYDDFPDIPKFAEKCSKSFSGEYKYRYLDKNLEKTVDKKAFWTTIGLYGTEWRLICIREI